MDKLSLEMEKAQVDYNVVQLIQYLDSGSMSNDFIGRAYHDQSVLARGQIEVMKQYSHILAERLFLLQHENA